MNRFVDEFSRVRRLFSNLFTSRKCIVFEGKSRDAVWNRLKPLFVTMLAVEQCASWRQRWPRAEQEGESESRGASPCASLVSYGAWPGDQGRFYSREAEPRVPASRRDAVAKRREERWFVQGARVAWGTERQRAKAGREVRRGRWGEGNDGGKERLQREGERGGSSYNAPLVHCPEVRKKARERDSGIEQEKRRIYCPLARSNLSRPSLSLSHTSLLLRSSPPFPFFSLHSAKR